MLNLNYDRDSLFDNYSLNILKERYLLPEEKSPQEAFARAAMAFADNEEHAQRLYDYVSQHWFMFATPVLSNGGTTRGLPISCFLQYVPDSRDGILEHHAEGAILASAGGGLGAGWSALRSDGTTTSHGSKTTGIIPFIRMMDSMVLAFKQGTNRRAAYATYLDISHPEIVEFLQFRKPTGGDVNRKALNLHHAVNIPDEFMEAVASGTDWNLVDPHTKEVKNTIPARKLWYDILETRMLTGEPYIHFNTTSNNARPEVHKLLNLLINNSNLCSEIYLPTSEDRTAVCCLSSLNLEKYDEWKDTKIVEDLICMLDNVITAFVEMKHVKPSLREHMKKAINSAKRERSLGLGAMGFHALLQNKMIPFESEEARQLNDEIFKLISTRAEEASIARGNERGFAPDYVQAAETLGVSFNSMNAKRNVHLMAVAPNASSSILCGNTSPSIEPFNNNAFAQKTSSGTNIYKNKALVKLMIEKGMDEDAQEKAWSSILRNQGSVQKEKWLTAKERDVFKTAFEMNQEWVVQHAVDRQKYIDQGQSVNLFFKPEEDANKISKVHFKAWRGGLKGLYYLRTMTDARADDIGKRFDRHTIRPKSTKTVLPNGMEIGCIGCDG